MKSVLDIEDFIQFSGIIENGFRDIPTTCHGDSYGAVVNYGKLQLLPIDSFSVDEWNEALDYWKNNENCGTPWKLIGMYIKEKLK